MSIDLTSKRFGNLVVGERAGSKNGKPVWFCRCDCGSTKVILGDSLRTGKTRSCGCAKRRQSSQRLTTHGMSGTPAYSTWQNMVRRCTDPKNLAFHRYGGRGITVCDKWKTFEGFWEDMSSGYDQSLSLDRIDNDGNYEPGNCRWATPSEQSRNKRNTLFIEYQGVKIPVIDVAGALGMNYFTFRESLDRIAGRKKGQIAC